MAIFNKGYEGGNYAPGTISGDTVIAQGVHVEGQFKSDGNVVIEGNVKGSVATSQHLVVGQHSHISAEVSAGSADVSGIIEGNLKIAGKLELRASCQILGDISAQDLMIESGAVLNGRVTMDGPGEEVAEKNQE